MIRKTFALAAVGLAAALFAASARADYAPGHYWPEVDQHVTSATVSIRSVEWPNPDAYAMVWVGVNTLPVADGLNWIQAGIVASGNSIDHPGAWLYVETMIDGDHEYDFIRPVAFGQQIPVSLSQDGWSWSVTMDGVTYGPVEIDPSKVWTQADAETYTGPAGGSPVWSWSITDSVFWFHPTPPSTWTPPPFKPYVAPTTPTITKAKHKAKPKRKRRG